MLFGQFRYLSVVHTSDIQFCDEGFVSFWTMLRRPLHITTGNGILSDGEGRKCYLRPIFQVLDFVTLLVYSKSDDSDLWHRSTWQCQPPKFGERSSKQVQKTIVLVYLSTARRRRLLQRQVLINLVSKYRLLCSIFNSIQICILENIETRWKFSLRGRHPHLMIPLSRCCLFQSSKIISNSASNMQ